MDGSAFAAPFAAGADFVTIRGEHFRGQAAIAAGMHVHSMLDVLQGPLAERHGACFSLVLTKERERGGWRSPPSTTRFRLRRGRPADRAPHRPPGVGSAEGYFH